MLLLRHLGHVRHHADRAEAAITGERKRADRAECRADELSGRLDEMEVNLAAAAPKPTRRQRTRRR
jgi:hypothetical protein